jgi:hypothetical protein
LAGFVKQARLYSYGASRDPLLFRPTHSLIRSKTVIPHTSRDIQLYRSLFRVAGRCLAVRMGICIQRDRWPASKHSSQQQVVVKDVRPEDVLHVASKYRVLQITGSGDDTQGKKYLVGLRRTTSLPCPLSICHSAYIGKSKEVGVKLSDMMPFCSVEAYLCRSIAADAAGFFCKSSLSGPQNGSTLLLRCSSVRLPPTFAFLIASSYIMIYLPAHSSSSLASHKSVSLWS